MSNINVEELLNRAILLFKHKRFGYLNKINKIAKYILEFGNPAQNCLFACKINCCDILPHEIIVLESNNPLLSFRFAKDVKGANIMAHEKIVCDSKEIHYMYSFAKLVVGANIDYIIKKIDEADPKYFIQNPQNRKKLENMQKILVNEQ